MFDNKELREEREKNEKLVGEMEEIRKKHAEAISQVSYLNYRLGEMTKQQSETEKLRRQVMELKEDKARLGRRCQGLQNALGKWQRKAKKQPVEDDLVFAELKKQNGKLTYTETWVISVPADPHIVRDAWDCFKKKYLNEPKQFRIYYHDKYGWVAVIEKEW